MGSSYSDSAKYELAEPLLKRSVKELEEVLGPKHRETNAAKFNYALLAYRKDAAAGLEVLEKACDEMEASLGGGHDVVASARQNVLICFETQGQVERGLRLGERFLQSTLKAVGENHYNTASARRRLVPLLLLLGRFEEARVQSELAFKTLERDGFKHVESARAASSLGQSLDGLKRHADAAEWHRRAVELAEKKSGAGSLEHAGCLSHSARNLLHLKDWAGAERTATLAARDLEALAQKKIVLPWLAAEARSMHGEALLGQNKHSDAEPLLKSAYEFLSANSRTISAPNRPRVLSEAADRLRRLHEAKGDKAAAEQWKKTAEDAKAKR